MQIFLCVEILQAYICKLSYVIQLCLKNTAFVWYFFMNYCVANFKIEEYLYTLPFDSGDLKTVSRDLFFFDFWGNKVQY